MELKHFVKLEYWNDEKVLIVPYGIETAKRTFRNGKRNCVLIVPYGIETCYFIIKTMCHNSVNCTLWN